MCLYAPSAATGGRRRIGENPRNAVLVFTGCDRLWARLTTPIVHSSRVGLGSRRCWKCKAIDPIAYQGNELTWIPKVIANELFSVFILRFAIQQVLSEEVSPEISRP
jgi:hypothetical protein